MNYLVPNDHNQKKVTISIGLKISLGLFLLFIIFASILYISYSRIVILESTSQQLQEISSQTVEIYETNIKVIQLQNAVSVYSNTGSDSIFTSAVNLHQEVKNKLSIAKNHIDESAILEILNNMTIIIDRYGDNLGVLQKRYQFRDTLINDSLPNIRQRGFDIIDIIISESSSTISLMFDAQTLKSDWAELNLDVSLYLLNRQFRLRRQINQKIEAFERDLASLKQGSQIKVKTTVSDLEVVLREYRSILEQSVQANRIYRSLVNVVMAADAEEFSSLANLLEDNYVDLLNTSKNENQQEIKFLRQAFLGSIFVSVPIILLLFAYYNKNISQGIKQITNTFERYINNDFSSQVPGKNRRDEIALLADAAQKFQILNANLKKATDQANESARIKADFLANMSHEIRTPMNGILGMISIMQNTELNDEQEEMVNVIASSGESLLTVLNDILDLSKAEAGKIILEDRTFSLKALGIELEYLYQNQASAKGIQFVLEVDDYSLPKYIQGDQNRLKQVLINLLSNAIKFTSEGEVRLKMVGFPLSDDQCAITFMVQDTGIGIKESDQDKLFEAFSQADTSITRQFGGTGLGLSISSKLVELMGGIIQLKSTYGEGSCFSFTVNFKASESIDDEIDKTSSANIFKQKLKILLVEDNKVNQMIAVKMLTNLGHELSVADNGQIAVEKCKKDQFDIIFMDMQMPVMDGVEATKIIRQNTAYDEVPIIAMTANVMAEDKKKCFAAGMNDFIPKPIDSSKLSTTISQSFIKQKRR